MDVIVLSLIIILLLAGMLTYLVAGAMDAVLREPDNGLFDAVLKCKDGSETVL